MKPLVATVIGVWFGLIVLLGATAAFARPAESPPLPILIGAMVPLLGFVAAYLAWERFRNTVLAADLRLLTALQAWRAGGLGFLALSANGVLPRLFAWPAGWGDILVGVTAPWVALALVRRPSFGGSRLFVAWNLLGILDLLVAVSMGVLNSGFIPGVVGDVTTAPMARLPLVVIPAFLVPLFVMLHLVALFQARRNGASGVDPALARHGGLSYLEIPATDPRVSMAFYGQVVGWTPRGEDGDQSKFSDRTGHLIGRFVTGGAATREPALLPFMFVDDVRSAAARVAACGGHILKEPYAEGTLLVAIARDPAGNTIGLWQDQRV